MCDASWVRAGCSFQVWLQDVGVEFVVLFLTVYFALSCSIGLYCDIVNSLSFRKRHCFLVICFSVLIPLGGHPTEEATITT